MKNLKKNAIKIWKEKGAILEGIKNNIFKTDHIEEIAKERIEICNGCPSINIVGDGCMVPGTNPCCGECGCTLQLAIRSLSKECPLKKWPAVLTFEEEYELQLKLRENDSKSH